MNETLRRRLVGAAVLLAAAFMLSVLVPAPDLPVESTGESVVFEMNPPPPATPAVALPVTPVEPLRPPTLKLTPALNAAAPAKAGKWFVQIGSFGRWENAQAALTRMQVLGHSGVVERVQSGTTALHRVRIGPYVDAEKARTVLSAAANEGFNGAKLVGTSAP